MALDSPWGYLVTLHEDVKKSGDRRVADWFLVRSPLPVIGIFISYMFLVNYGPRIMEKRPAFKLKYLMLIYNTFQVGLSAYMFYEFLVTAILSRYNLTCQPVDTSMDPLALRMASVCWFFYFSKIIDMVDTVFFVLRKKNNQLTFLHIFHHSTMIFNWWLGVKYVPGGQSFFCAMLNSLVHVVMYSYYLLSSLGAWIQPYLWWKRYLTQFQIVQFVLIVIHISVGHYNNCDFPSALGYMLALYCLTLLVFFSNFYIQAYIRRSKKQS
ncbi:hypothetical protein OUZ56_002849 [Daphnia magna]|uniref:Elongation of very long chain fatty acids protein n=1 Tax=Daphnia magna TaxID=35525 RepID=A0ABR0A6Z3_9CRUS|nr:hypothetical protein OUZ56_002849 [Daphnia magna]